MTSKGQLCPWGISQETLGCMRNALLELPAFSLTGFAHTVSVRFYNASPSGRGVGYLPLFLFPSLPDLSLLDLPVLPPT